MPNYFGGNEFNCEDVAVVLVLLVVRIQIKTKHHLKSKHLKHTSKLISEFLSRAANFSRRFIGGKSAVIPSPRISAASPPENRNRLEKYYARQRCQPVTTQGRRRPKAAVPSREPRRVTQSRNGSYRECARLIYGLPQCGFPFLPSTPKTFLCSLPAECKQTKRARFISEGKILKAAARDLLQKTKKRLFLPIAEGGNENLRRSTMWRILVSKFPAVFLRTRRADSGPPPPESSLDKNRFSATQNDLLIRLVSIYKLIRFRIHVFSPREILFININV